MSFPLRRLLSVIALTAVTLTGVGLAGTATPAEAATDGQQKLLSKINNARENHDLRRMALRKRLSEVAKHQAERMAANGSLSHTDNLGSKVGHWLRLGENVAYADTIAEAHRLLMNSSPHRANILDGGFREVGLGIAHGRGKVWISEVFRKPTYPRTVKYGSEGDAVRTLQKRLDIKVTGTFGGRTENAVQNFQDRRDLDAHGVCGFRTWIALGY